MQRLTLLAGAVALAALTGTALIVAVHHPMRASRTAPEEHSPSKQSPPCSSSRTVCWGGPAGRRTLRRHDDRVRGAGPPRAERRRGAAVHARARARRRCRGSRRTDRTRAGCARLVAAARPRDRDLFGVCALGGADSDVPVRSFGRRLFRLSPKRVAGSRCVRVRRTSFIRARTRRRAPPARGSRRCARTAARASSARLTVVPAFFRGVLGELPLRRQRHQSPCDRHRPAR